MPRISAAAVLRHLTRTDMTPPDRDLLAKFVTERDGTAFAELVHRHGPMVLAVCRRGTCHWHDADDAFQAVFLTFVRRAATVQNPDLLGNWLYGVAVRVAWRSRRAASRRRVHETQESDAPEPIAPPESNEPDLGPILDEELTRLSAWHRDAILLCDLRGLSRSTAATQLGIPLGTLASRLDAARKKLAHRLSKRGVTLAVGTMPIVLAEQGQAALTPALANGTIESILGPGGMAVSASVVQLTQGSVNMRKVFPLGLLTATFAVVGIGFVLRAGIGVPIVEPSMRVTMAETVWHGKPVDEPWTANPPVLPAAPSPKVVVADPKEAVLAAWESTEAGLKSGVGEGIFETSIDGAIRRFAIKVVHDGPKFRVELERLDRAAMRGGVSAAVVIYDGETCAYREVNSDVRPIGEQAFLVTVADGVDAYRYLPDLPFRLNPSRLQSAIVDLPALLHNLPETSFSRAPDGVAATGSFSMTPPIVQTIWFPRDAGYNPTRCEIHQPEAGYKRVGSMVWERSSGVWYAKEVAKTDVWPTRKASQKLTFTTYEANAKVDPDNFKLPALGLAPGARFRFLHFDTRSVDVYTNIPPAAPMKVAQTLLDGLRQLPEEYSVKPDKRATAPKN